MESPPWIDPIETSSFKFSMASANVLLTICPVPREMRLGTVEPNVAGPYEVWPMLGGLADPRLEVRSVEPLLLELDLLGGWEAASRLAKSASQVCVAAVTPGALEEVRVSAEAMLMESAVTGRLGV